MSEIHIELGDIEDKALDLAKISPDDIRGMDKSQLEEYIQKAGPVQQELYDAAERLMRLVRPVTDGLFVARERQYQ